MILDNGKAIRLIGLKEKLSKPASEVMDFLQKTIMGNKVLIKLDESVTNDFEGDILVYLYLQNKTFINAHLIKKELVDIDTSYEYKYKERFIKYYKTKL